MLAGNSQLGNTMGGIEQGPLPDDLCWRFLFSSRIYFDFQGDVVCGICIVFSRDCN